MESYLNLFFQKLVNSYIVMNETITFQEKNTLFLKQITINIITLLI